MFGTPRSNSQRREISADRAKLDELRTKCKIREETYKIEIDKLRQKLDKIRNKFEQQQKYRQNSQEMQRLKEENLFLKSQVSYQKQQLDQSFQINTMIYSSRETSGAKRAQSSRSNHMSNKEHHQNQNSNSSSSSSKAQIKQQPFTNKKVNASEMELIKISQHKLMKENKNLKKRVDIMSSQMKELYDILLEEKTLHSQYLSNNNNNNITGLINNNNNHQQDLDQFKQQNNSLKMPQNISHLYNYNNISDQLERNHSPIEKIDHFIEENNHNNINNSNQKQKSILSNGKNYDQSIQNQQNLTKKINFDTNQQQQSSNGLTLMQNGNISPQQILGNQDNQILQFQEKIEITKRIFIDKIKNIFIKHQKQNQIFENNNQKMKEMTKQLFSKKTKKNNNNSNNNNNNDDDDEEQKNYYDLQNKIIKNSESSSTSSIISNSELNNDSNINNSFINETKDSHVISQNKLANKFDDQNYLKDYDGIINNNNQNKEDIQDEQEIIELEQDRINQKDIKNIEQTQKKTTINLIQNDKLNKIPQTSYQKNFLQMKQNQILTIDKSQNDSKLDIQRNEKTIPKQMLKDSNFEKQTELKTKQFQRESLAKGEEFRSLKEQFGTFLSNNKNNSSSINNISNTVGISNNYIQSNNQTYSNEKQQITKRLDPLTSFQVPINYPLLQNTSSASTSNKYRKNSQNGNHQFQHLSINLNQNNYNNNNNTNFNDYKNHDMSGSNSFQTQNFLQKIQSNTSRNFEYKSGKPFELEFIGHSTQISPLKEQFITNRNKEEIDLNIPSSTQSQNIQFHDFKNETKQTNKGSEWNNNNNNYNDNKIDRVSKLSKLTTPLMTASQQEKITDEYIKQIIQQYKTPKKPSVTLYSSTNQSNNYQPIQSFMIPSKKQNNLSSQQQQSSQQNQQKQQQQQKSYDKRDYLNGQSGQIIIQNKAQTSRLYDQSYSQQQNYMNSNDQNNTYLGNGLLSTQNINSNNNNNNYNNNNNNNQASSPNRLEKPTKLTIQASTPKSIPLTNSNNLQNISNPSTSSYTKDLNIYNCYFNNNSPINKKISHIYPPAPGNISSTTNRETLNLNHKRQQSCGGGGFSSTNKYNLKLNLTSLVTPKSSSQILQSERQNSDRTGYNRLISKTQNIVSSNISPKYSPHSSQTTSVNRLNQK